MHPQPVNLGACIHSALEGLYVKKKYDVVKVLAFNLCLLSATGSTHTALGLVTGNADRDQLHLLWNFRCVQYDNLKEVVMVPVDHDGWDVWSHTCAQMLYSVCTYKHCLVGPMLSGPSLLQL